MQKPYYRDIWCLSPGSGYPGAFPKGLVKRVLRRYNSSPKLMLFSGSFHDLGWETVDVNTDVRPTYAFNAEELPALWTDRYGFVFADPPYSEMEAQELYGLPYFNIVKLVNEMARVTRPGGYMILLHRLIPTVHPDFNEHFKRMKIQAVIGVYTIAGISNLRALTVWKKNGSLHDTEQI